MEIGEGLKYVIGIDPTSFFLILLLLYCLLEFCHVIPEKRFKSVFCNRSDYFLATKFNTHLFPVWQLITVQWINLLETIL